MPPQTHQASHRFLYMGIMLLRLGSLSIIMHRIFFNPQLFHARDEDSVQDIVKLNNFDEDVLPVSLASLFEEDKYDFKKFG